MLVAYLLTLLMQADLSLVNLILGATVLEERVYLPGRGYSGIDVGLSRLCAHLLGRAEITSLKLREIGIRVRLDVGYVLQVLALGHEP